MMLKPIFWMEKKPLRTFSFLYKSIISDKRTNDSSQEYNLI